MAQKELGVQPVMSGEDMANCEVPDKLTMVSYLSQLYDVLKKETLPLRKFVCHIFTGLYTCNNTN